MLKDSSPTIQGFRVRAVRVPMTEPHQTVKHGCQAYTVDREPQKQISKIVSDLDLSNV